MDFRAAARSVLLVGRLKNDRDIRVMVHDKSSLAPEGNSRGFTLDNGTLHWQEGTKLSQRTSCSAAATHGNKVALAEDLIRDTAGWWAPCAGQRDLPVGERRRHLPAHSGDGQAQYAGRNSQKIEKLLGLVAPLTKTARP